MQEAVAQQLCKEGDLPDKHGMFETFQRLHHWLQANNIDKPVTVTFHADAVTAYKIGCVLRDEFYELAFKATSFQPVSEGQIYGIAFKIEPISE